MKYIRRYNTHQNWVSYCSKHIDFLTELNIDNWVFRNEGNFRDFVTYGKIDDKFEIEYNFSILSDETYFVLFNFITNYFDADMEFFDKFNSNIKNRKSTK